MTLDCHFFPPKLMLKKMCDGAICWIFYSKQRTTNEQKKYGELCKDNAFCDILVTYNFVKIISST